MKRTAGITASLFALLALALSISANAETVSAVVPLSPANENPPIAGLNAGGVFSITVVVNRDASGAILGGTVNFLGAVSFPGATTFTGLHIHEGVITANGPVRIDTGISAANPLVFATGTGLIDRTAQNVSAAVLQSLLSNPTGWYVNLHTTVNPGGAIRGQIVRFVETLATTVQMSPANEVPPITGLNASGVGTITVNPIRRVATGEVIGGTVTFSLTFGGFPDGTVLTGLHIHEGAAGTNAGVVINTGVGGANTITLPTGRGSLNFEVPITAAATIPVLQRLIANPVGFYVNLHTTVNTGGAIRGQLVPLAAPPIIHQSNTHFLETGSADATIILLATGIDTASTVLVNGTTVTGMLNTTTGGLSVTIPAALRANAGTLFVQARNTQGLLSAPVIIPVAAAASVNSVAVTTTDAAKYGNLAAPGAIVAGFGARLASQAVSATALPLPTALDGTSVYVNGVAARLIFVSGNQINYLIPVGTAVGQAAIVVVARDGTVSRGALNIAQSAPGLFTMLNNGTGAPAAVASADGQNFNILMGNPDGTPREIGAGNFVALFGAGFRFASSAMTMMIGTTNVTPAFVGAQGQFDGLDQINLQIPQSMAGAGNVDLIFSVDGRMSNLVKLRIR